MQLREIHIAPGEDVANANDQKGIGNVEECTWFLKADRLERVSARCAHS
jgi:hypothetical protein